jgi:hypothetical protein
VLILAPHATEQIDITDTMIREELTNRTSRGLTKRDAIDEVTAALGVSRKRVYTLAVKS